MPWGMGPWGWGYPPRYGPYGQPFGGYGGYAPSREQEKQMLLDWQKYLQEQKKYLDDQLDQVSSRLAELEKSE